MLGDNQLVYISFREVISDLDIFNNEMATVLGAPVYPALGLARFVLSLIPILT